MGPYEIQFQDLGGHGREVSFETLKMSQDVSRCLKMSQDVSSLLEIGMTMCL